MMLLIALAAATVQPAVPPSHPRGEWGAHREGRGPGMGPGPNMDRFFDMADTDKNGQISRAEFKAAGERMRANRDKFREMRNGQGGSLRK